MENYWTDSTAMLSSAVRYISLYICLNVHASCIRILLKFLCYAINNRFELLIVNTSLPLVLLTFLVSRLMLPILACLQCFYGCSEGKHNSPNRGNS